MHKMRVLCWEGPKSFIAPEPGPVDRKASRTTIVLTKRQERHKTKLTPKAAWRSLHVHVEGLPMKAREQRKHSFSDTSNRKLISELLALTMGVARK